MEKPFDMHVKTSVSVIHDELYSCHSERRSGVYRVHTTLLLIPDRPELLQYSIYVHITVMHMFVIHSGVQLD